MSHGIPRIEVTTGFDAVGELRELEGLRIYGDVPGPIQGKNGRTGQLQCQGNPHGRRNMESALTQHRCLLEGDFLPGLQMLNQAV